MLSALEAEVSEISLERYLNAESWSLALAKQKKPRAKFPNTRRGLLRSFKEEVVFLEKQSPAVRIVLSFISFKH